MKICYQYLEHYRGISEHYRDIFEHYRAITWEFENNIIGKTFGLQMPTAE